MNRRTFFATTAGAVAAARGITGKCAVVDHKTTCADAARITTPQQSAISISNIKELRPIELVL